MNQEILGKWVRKVDYKWRLVIPASVREMTGQTVLLKLNAEGCIEVEKSSPKKIDSATSRRMRNGRITIPSWLRNSTSFYFGEGEKKVMVVVSKNGHCEIWPWR